MQIIKNNRQITLFQLCASHSLVILGASIPAISQEKKQLNMYLRPIWNYK